MLCGLMAKVEKKILNDLVHKIKKCLFFNPVRSGFWKDVMTGGWHYGPSSFF